MDHAPAADRKYTPPDSASLDATPTASQTLSPPSSMGENDKRQMEIERRRIIHNQIVRRKKLANWIFGDDGQETSSNSSQVPVPEGEASEAGHERIHHSNLQSEVRPTPRQSIRGGE